MKAGLVLTTLALACCSIVTAKNNDKPAPPSIDSLLKLAYKDHPQDIPNDCTTLHGGTVVNQCNNGTSPLMRISQFHIDRYPLEPGHTKFFMVYKLKGKIKKGSKLHIHSFSDLDEEIFEGELDLCDYLEFANIQCPVDITEGFQEMRQTLEIPNDVPPGVYSFIASATTADNRLLLRIAANMELINSHYNSIVHDEL